MSPSTSVLRQLARLYSIETRELSREQLLAALKMRIPPGVDFAEALREREEKFRSRYLEPVTVVWGGRAPEIDLRLPQELADTPIEWHLTLEDGSTREGRAPGERASRPQSSGVSPGDSGDDSSDRAGRPLTAGETPALRGKTLTLDPVPFGYHVLQLTIGTEKRETFLMSAPAKAHPLKTHSWGISVPLYAAHTERSWGTGDLGDLEAYRGWINGLGGGVIATLPLLAGFVDEPSPYSPVSRLFWNEMYLDVTRLPEFNSQDVDPFAIESLTKTALIDYEAVVREKRHVLEKMMRRFQKTEDFRAWAMRGCYGYAHFRGFQESAEHPQVNAEYHLYVQYRMAQQMRQAADDARSEGVGLYLDFPLGVNRDGYDAWKYSDIFAKGVSVGAPPDLFFTKGQNWGYPPLDPDAIRERRHQYFRDCIRHHVSHAGVLRIDHVMGLHRLFWIPEGGEPKDGFYVRYPEQELYAAVMIESTRHRCAIVGETLGTVPPDVPKMMTKRGLRRMYVVQYQMKPDVNDPLPPPAAQSVASLNTHDMPTFAAFWKGKSIGGARGLLHTPEGTPPVQRLLRFLADSPAELVLINLEDLWLEENAQNVPGVPERSWRNRFRYTLEQIREMPDVVETLRMIDERRRKADGIR